MKQMILWSVICCTSVVCAQPTWVSKTPEPDRLYTYYVGAADGVISAATEEKAFRNAIEQLALAVGGLVQYEHVVRRHDELQVSQTKTRLITDFATDEVIKADTYATVQCTWVLIQVRTALIYEKRMQFISAKNHRTGIVIQIVPQDTLAAYLESALVRYFTVSTDSTRKDVHRLTYQVDSRLFTTLGNKMCYRYTVRLRVLQDQEVTAAYNFAELGRGWSQSLAQEEAFRLIASRVGYFLAVNLY